MARDVHQRVAKGWVHPHAGQARIVVVQEPRRLFSLAFRARWDRALREIE